MNDALSYKIPDEYFFRLNHVRPRFKENIEEVLLYVATSISEMEVLPKKEFDEKLNEVLFAFKDNSTRTKKTIDNWRTEISALFGFLQMREKNLMPAQMAIRLADNQYLDEFFNYFLYTFQYPGGHNRPDYIRAQINAKIKFKPCSYILNILIEGEKILNKPFSLTAEELTQCAYYDLRVTRDSRAPSQVAELIVENRMRNIKYDHRYEQLKDQNTGDFPSSGDVYRYAGDILDYMVLANLLHHKGTGYYYYLNDKNMEAINYQLSHSMWFDGYDKFYKQAEIINSEVADIGESWIYYVNSFDNIEVFKPHLDLEEVESISSLIQEYHSQLKGGKSVPTKIIGDYGESLVLLHEYLRVKDKSNRQHIINKIPTHLAVGYDIQSIEIEKRKRYIEVKTTKSKKAITNNRFKLTPNEFDTAETIGDRYFIYYLVVNEKEKKIFTIQNPIKQLKEGTLRIDKHLVVSFSKDSGIWERLLEK